MRWAARVGKASAEGRRVVCDAEFGLLAVGACRGLRDQHLGRIVRVETFIRIPSFTVRVMFRKVRFGALNLNEAFAADILVATSGAVQVRRICQEADWALLSVFVQENLHRLAVHKGIVRESDLLGRQIG